MEEKVKDIIADVLKITDKEKITSSAKFVEDLQGDSLSNAELMMAFEEEFGIEISPEKAKEMSSVGDVINYIKENVTQ